MKMVKSLLLGSAAGLVAIAGAQAADLPVKAKPVEYVKVCSAYGAGFYYMPGTDTCLKIGGYVYAEYNLNSNGDGVPYFNGFNGQNTRESTPAYNTRFRGFLSLDARTQTEYGTLRSYILLGMEQFSAQNSYGNTAQAGQTNGAFIDTTYRGATYFARAFIQFAGITAGKTVSFFDFYDGTLNWQTSGVIGSVTGFGMNVLAYTVQFGGGISASLSLEENEHRRVGIWNANSTFVAGAGGLPVFNGDPFAPGIPGQGVPVYGDHAAWRYPDIVANLRIDQPWGSAQVMGAIHDASAGCAYGASAGLATTAVTGGASPNRCLTTTGASNYYDDATGFAVGGGVKFNLPWAKGDSLWLQGIFARGASSYVGFNTNITYNNFAWYDNGTRGAGPGAIGSIAIATPLDGVVSSRDGSTGVSLTDSYNLFAAVQHFWTPGLRTSVWGGVSGVNYGGSVGDLTTAKGKYCDGLMTSTVAPGGIGVVGTTGTRRAGTCNPDFSLTQIGSRTIWSPVANLDIGLEVIYTRLDQNFEGNWQLPAAGSRPGGQYTATDRDAWTGIFRIQRNFWP